MTSHLHTRIPRTEPSDIGSVRRGQDDADVEALARVAGKSQRHSVVIGMIVGALLAAAAAVFILQNTGSIAMHFLGGTFRAPVWAALLVMFGCGAIASPLIVLLARRAKRRRRRDREVIRETVGGGARGA
jgi:uncharacterized integral membrane protein